MLIGGAIAGAAGAVVVLVQGQLDASSRAFLGAEGEAKVPPSEPGVPNSRETFGRRPGVFGGVARRDFALRRGSPAGQPRDVRRALSSPSASDRRAAFERTHSGAPR
jgi:hypothetical protein